MNYNGRARSARLPLGTSRLLSPAGTRPVTDWYSEGQPAVDNQLERQRKSGTQRSFARQSAPPPPPGKPGIFGPEPEHKAGTVEGGQRFWVTDNCYFDVPRGSPPPRQAGEFHLLTRQCKPPATGGGDRMFEDLTPGYLKSKPNAKSSVAASLESELPANGSGKGSASAGAASAGSSPQP